MTSAANLIREARQRASLTQHALAERSGIAQNVISDYERGRREPSFRAVDLLLNAADVALEIVPSSALDRVRNQRDALTRAFSARGATNIQIFGSIARGEARVDSDVDLLVDVAEGTGLLDLLQLQLEAEAILGRRVDLADRSTLKPEVAATALRDAVPL